MAELRKTDLYMFVASSTYYTKGIC